MSHKATNWLASLEPKLLKSSEFRVLFHLCDCHNPSQGCFPSQEYLRTCSGVSNGTLNNALNTLEDKLLIARNRTWDNKTKRQMPTRYLLGFEGEIKPKPSPETGDGAVSNPEGEPSPKNGQSRLQPTGEEPVKEPVNNRAGAREATKLDRKCDLWAKHIKNGSFIPPSAISITMAQKMISDGSVQSDDLRRLGIRF